MLQGGVDWDPTCLPFLVVKSESYIAFGRGPGSALVHISHVPLDRANKNVILAGLGSYLVNALVGCGNWQTNPTFLPSGNLFIIQGLPKQISVTGYLAGGQKFGNVVSRNLTAENGLPAGRTYAHFQHIMRTGIDLDKAHPQIGPLLQVMPWPTYQNLSDRDLLAIYTYLSAIPAIRPKN